MASTLRLFVFGLAAAATACGSGQSPAPPASSVPSASPSASAPAGLTRYDLKGKIVSIDKAAQQMTIDHEAVPGFMSAMTMAYAVKDRHALDTLAPGEQVTATLVAGNGAYWLEDVTATTSDSAR